MRTTYLPVSLRANSEQCYVKKIKDALGDRSVYFKTLFSILVVISIYYGGVLTCLFEENYLNFHYSPEVNDFRGLIENLDLQLESRGDNSIGKSLSGFESIVSATNQLKLSGQANSSIYPVEDFKNLDFLIDVNQTCQEQFSDHGANEDKDFISFIIVVKTAVNYYDKRNAIRKSWYLNGEIGSFRFKTVFMVGACHEMNPVPQTLLKARGLNSWSMDICNQSIREESRLHGDIIQSSGVDSYYNNTIKSFMILRWVQERCKTDFFIAIDDDYVLEMDNLIIYLKKLAADYLPGNSITSNNNNLNYTHNISNNDNQSVVRNISIDSVNVPETYILNNQYLSAFKRLSSQYVWSGYMRKLSRPYRIITNKWYVSRADYPFDKYPEYLTGGMIVMSRKTAKHLYLGIYFSKKFKFDDVYMGIVAKRLGLVAYHSDNYMCHIRDYLAKNPFRPNITECLGVHDIEANKLVKLWEIRKQISEGDMSLEEARTFIYL